MQSASQVAPGTPAHVARYVRTFLDKFELQVCPSQAGAGQNYKTVLFTALSSIMDSAVEDKLITANPCKGNSIKRPTSSSPDIAVWPEDRLRAVQSGLADRFRIVCAAGAGCGLRQGEILGLSLDDTDLADMCLHVQRQIRIVERTLVFALPKGGKKRRVPLSAGVCSPPRKMPTWRHCG